MAEFCLPQVSKNLGTVWLLMISEKLPKLNESLDVRLQELWSYPVCGGQPTEEWGNMLVTLRSHYEKMMLRH